MTMPTYTPTTTLPDCDPASWHDWIDADQPDSADERTEECSICCTIRHIPHRGRVWYEVPNQPPGNREHHPGPPNHFTQEQTA